MGFIDSIEKHTKGLDIIVRSAMAYDSEHLIQLIKNIDNENRYMIRKPGEFSKLADDMKKTIEKINESENSLYLVAESELVLLGYLKFEGKGKPRLKHKGEFTVGVIKNYWGYGIGGCLIEAMLDWCKDAGIIKVELKVAIENKRGTELYKRLGFNEVGKLEKDLRVSEDEYLDFLLMDKIIY